MSALPRALEARLGEISSVDTRLSTSVKRLRFGEGGVEADLVNSRGLEQTLTFDHVFSTLDSIATAALLRDSTTKASTSTLQELADELDGP
jgi:hypothetical protein